MQFVFYSGISVDVKLSDHSTHNIVSKFKLGGPSSTSSLMTGPYLYYISRSAADYLIPN